jgi:sialate O-acetylesterase
MRRWFLVCGWFYLMATSAALAQTKLSPIFQDHMVLQRQMVVPIWGKDKPNQRVKVFVAGQSKEALTGPDGKWKVILPVLGEGGGPYEMKVTGSTTLTVKDVMVGEVWLASGQSNMELPLNNTNGAEKELARGGDPQIRWFVQERRLSDEPEEKPLGTWKICTPGNAKDFSATAYYFAKKLRKELGVPVGILGSYWGGTWIESWIPRETFESDPSVQPIYDAWKALSADEQQARCGLQKMDMEIRRLRLTSKNSTQTPINLLSPTQNWSSNAQPGSAVTFNIEEDRPLEDEYGIVHAEIQTGGWGNCTLPLAAKGAPLDLSAYDTIEFEAKGTGKFNVILEQPIISDWDNYGSEPFTIAGDWKPYQIAFSALKQSGWGKPKPFQPTAINAICLNACVDPMGMRPVALYDGMVAPLVPYGIRGAIWYQGETNVGHAQEYRKLLPALIKGWRQAWGIGEFPFIFAQLPNWNDPNLNPGNGWPELREAQASALSLPNTGMAILIDIGESNDIHPKNKADVGLRLGLAALHEAYDRTEPFSGPLFDFVTVKGSKLVVRFKHTDGGLKAKGPVIEGFEVKGEDGNFVPAKAEISKNEVLVWSDQVAHPQGVRYAWANDPKCNLFNGAGLPAGPFRTGFTHHSN